MKYKNKVSILFDETRGTIVIDIEKSIATVDLAIEELVKFKKKIGQNARKYDLIKRIVEEDGIISYVFKLDKKNVLRKSFKLDHMGLKLL